jgi:hypothetical protein
VAVPDDISLTPGQRQMLLEAVAAIAPTSESSRRWIRLIGLQVAALPAWTPQMNAEDWWDEVFAQFDLGRGDAPYSRLIAEIARVYPANRAVTGLRARTGAPAAPPPPDPETFTPGTYVFISYSRKDADYVAKLVAHLKASGVTAWIDDRVDYGTRWLSVIEQHLRDCGAVVVVMSPESRASEWVERELMLAGSLKKIVFPLVIDGEPFFELLNRQVAFVPGGAMPPDDVVQRIRSVLT